MNKVIFSGKVGLQQRVFPKYRMKFFERLAEVCGGNLSLFAGNPRKTESIIAAEELRSGELVKARNIHLLGGRFYICLQAGLMQWLTHWDPDVLILEANPRYLNNRMAINWMHQRDRPVVGWGLGVPDASGALSGMQTQGRDRYMTLFDAMISYSTIGAAQYVASGMSDERVFVAVNSVSPPPESFHVREPIEDRSPRVLFVGRLQVRKRVDNLLLACASLEQMPELWIVGDGPEGTNLKNLANRIYPSAEFKGALEGSDLEDCFLGADLFVLPGTGGLAVQEAMTHGLPVIVAAGDGTQRDLVTDENGWLVEAGDLDDLKRAMSEAFSDASRLPNRGEASFQIVRERANIDVMAKVFVQALEFVRSGGK
jgi:glycosyltransferase involved in cell wall biosynthesis